MRYLLLTLLLLSNCAVEKRFAGVYVDSFDRGYTEGCWHMWNFLEQFSQDSKMITDSAKELLFWEGDYDMDELCYARGTDTGRGGYIYYQMSRGRESFTFDPEDRRYDLKME